MRDFFEYVGILFVLGCCAFLVGGLYSECRRSYLEARDRRRRQVEHELRLRARCGACGATNRVDFVPPHADVAYAIDAGIDILDRVREQRRRRRSAS